MPNRLRKAALVLAAAGSVSVLASSPAFAASTPKATVYDSSNWAGYYTLADAPVLGASVDFTVPKVSCANSRGTATPGIGYEASMWIGIGGMKISTGSAGNNWLEQDGVEVLCSSLKATPVYKPFFEIVPTAKDPDSYYHEPVIFREGSAQARVQAGDNIEAALYTPEDSPRPGSWDFNVDVHHDGILKALTAYAKLPSGTYTGSPTSTARDTVEVITECPTVNHHSTGFADLGTVGYTDADYITSKSEDSYRIAGYPIYLVHSFKKRVTAAVSPGAQSTSSGSDVADDAFKTYYADKWWQ